MRRLGKFYLALGCLCVCFCPTPAQAHLVNTNVGPFYAGMMHPLTSLEHLLPMLALALFASSYGKGIVRLTLLVFPMALLAGLLAGNLLPAYSVVHLANLMILVGLGTLLMLGNRTARLNPSVIGVIVSVVGLILGYRSGNDMAVSTVAAQFVPGVVFTGFILVAIVGAWVPVTELPVIRMLAGVGFAGTGLVLLFQFTTGRTLSVTPGIGLPGEHELVAMLKTGQLTVPVVVGAIIAALMWGAGHALTPGHGKTIVAAYLIGGRSTPWHALYLGLTVTVTHTLGIFVLGLIALFASRYVVPEHLYPWLGAVSGLIVVGIGAGMLWNRARALRKPAFVPVEAEHDHNHALMPHHHYHHDHDHDHHHHHDHDHGHSHLPPGADDSPVTWRSLLALGISGGILPCPSALVLLLAAVSLNRVGFGIVLVLAFSVGLAAVLTTVGLLFVKGSRLLQGVPQAASWMRVLPVLSALAILTIGIGLTAEAVINIRV
jgi:ABC-type nickel/cobalt efflux system permease component RcnA/hydrogenase/urease accessory protein HupE